MESLEKYHENMHLPMVDGRRQSVKFIAKQAEKKTFVLTLHGKLVRVLEGKLTLMEAHELARVENKDRIRGTR